MKYRICFGLIICIIYSIILSSCGFDNGEDGLVRISAEFSINNHSRNSSEALYAVSGTETSLIVAVPASVNSVTTDGYLPANYDRQLLNLVDNTVTLSIPLNTSMRLIKANFDQILSLGQIAGTLPTASQIGISVPFSVSANDRTKAISISMNQGSVSPFYANGTSWNDYIKNDGSDIYTAGNIACDGTEASSDACIHAGEMRAFTVTGKSSCTNLTATDSLGAFEWACVSASPDVKFVSTSLNSNKNLSDLIDFTSTPPTWKSLTVTAMESGSAIISAGTTAWADNTITVDNDGGALGTEGTIYTVTSNPDASFSITADKVALVVEPGLSIKGNSLTASDTSSDVSADTVNFIWIEGSIDAANDFNGIYLDTVHFSVLRNVEILNAAGSSTNEAGLKLSAARYNIIKNISIRDGMGSGVYTTLSHDNRLSEMVSAHNRDWGFRFSNSLNNRMADIKAVDNWGTGVYLDGSRNNRIDRLVLFSNFDGLQQYNGDDNVFNGIVAANNSRYGITLSFSSNSFYSNVVAANNGLYGIFFTRAAAGVNPDLNSLSGIVTVNNQTGTFLDRLNNTSVYNLVTVSNTAVGIDSFTTDNGSYTGVLKVGGNTTDCSEGGGTLPGIDGACASSAALTTGVLVGSTFPGKVTADDTTNNADTSGQATYPTNFPAFDWHDFENSFRGWGIDHVDLFPTANHQGKFGCSSTSSLADAAADTSGTCLGTGTWYGTGRIWDWSVVLSDTVILDVLSMPTGNDTLTHTWSDASTTQYLQNAVEIMFDDIGNDNILCETGETCLFTPNVGAYQGHGALISAGAFTDGTLTGITLMKYATNGR